MTLFLLGAPTPCALGTLAEAPQPQRLPPEAASTSLPQAHLQKLARVQSQNGIVLSWSVLEVDRSCATVDSYHLYACTRNPVPLYPHSGRRLAKSRHFPLPMACTLTQFVSGSKYYFAVRAKDIYGRLDLSVILSQQMWSLLHRAVKPWSLSLFLFQKFYFLVLFLILCMIPIVKCTLCKISWTDVYIHYICL